MQVSAWSVLPFAMLLLCIGFLPLVAAKWWHRNRNKAIVSIGLSFPVICYLGWLAWFGEHLALEKLEHAGLEYASFTIMLTALFTIAGGIAVQGQFRPTPLVNTGILAFGAVIANVVGTTGASMLLIRPFLRINLVRANRGHLPIFFIIVVSNLGGLLTPLGDPPLFLGFINGVDFFWNLRMWPHWLCANGIVLAIAYGCDWWAFRREPNLSALPPRHGSLVLGGGINFLFLGGVLMAVVCQSPDLMGAYRLTPPWPSIITGAMAMLSWLFTSRTVREHNEFGWEPIIEVAVLFIGIFVTMIPALELLTSHRDDLGLSEPWQYFWLTGILSAFLDNAPTYMTFASLAGGAGGLGELSRQQSEILMAISAGAVFMGALTYIGNGPNFMVKSMAEQMGYRMPSFFGYFAFASLILLPVLMLLTAIFW